MTGRIWKRPEFVVGEIEEDINLSLPPADGEEYIKRVVLEARQYDDVLIAKVDNARLRKPISNVKPLITTECEKAPESVSPTLEWQQSQIADFSSIRLYIMQFKNQTDKNKDKWNEINKLKTNGENRKSWMDMCTISDEKHEPNLTVILSLKQPTIERVLKYLTEFLESQASISLHLGRWLYALLAALELPLNPDMCSCLRTLARICSVIRSRLDSLNEKDAMPLNLFICLVARYFRQLDLADS
ncbi:gem-associated protein 2 [Copidosoma floridanum]|uniref:gem-associated protein 2 n=1 Tax=Copidosoma floridanum TaxID=29053 RepID=UPI0006C9CB71|nr:gem-associated protein 2 [Copidosoma floridanum]